MEQKESISQKVSPSQEQLHALKEYLDTELQRINKLSPKIADQAINQIISAVSAVLKMFTLPEEAVNLCFDNHKIYAVPATLQTREACQHWIKQQQQKESIRD